MKTIDVKVRKSWGNLNPVSRIHGEGKTFQKPKYGKQDRHSWKKNLNY